VPETAPSGIPQGEGGGVCGAAGSSDAATAVPSSQVPRSRYGRVCRDQFDISRLSIAHGCPLLGLTALRGEHPHTLPSRTATVAPPQRLASTTTESPTGRPPKVRACGARDCSEWNPAGRGRRSLWRRRLERCRYGCPDPAVSGDPATAVPILRTREMPLQASSAKIRAKLLKNRAFQ
jgi:hypothetical protein